MMFSTFVEPRQERAEDAKEPMAELTVAMPGSYWDGPQFTARKLYSPSSEDEVLRESVPPIS